MLRHGTGHVRNSRSMSDPLPRVCTGRTEIAKVNATSCLGLYSMYIYRETA